MNRSEVLAAQKALRAKAESIFWQIFYGNDEWPRALRYRPSIDNIRFGESTVTICGSAPACGRGCCGYESHSYRFPASLLDMDNSEVALWVEATNAARVEKEAARQTRLEALRKVLAEKREVAASSHDRLRYLEAKAKYEAVDVSAEIEVAKEVARVADEAERATAAELAAEEANVPLDEGDDDDEDA